MSAGDKPTQGPLIDSWSWVFLQLSKLSLMTLLRKLFPGLRGSYRFVDCYVVLHTVLAFAAFFIVVKRADEPVSLLLQIVACYGILRVVDIFSYQCNVLLFDRYRAWQDGRRYVIGGYERMVVLIAHNYLELICWFGLFYVYLHRDGSISWTQGSEPAFLPLLRESMLMMVTFNSNMIQAQSSLGVTLLSVHSIVGLMLTLVVFARFLSLLPVPESLSSGTESMPAKSSNGLPSEPSHVKDAPKKDTRP